MSDIYKINKIADNIENMPSALNKELLSINTRTGNQTVRSARNMAPKKTGALRNSIESIATPYSLFVTAGKGLPRPYAWYQHYGTVHIAANPFLSNAARQHEPAWEKAVQKATEKVVADV
jgi:HK97 gp10 family phage protein